MNQTLAALIVLFGLRAASGQSLTFSAGSTPANAPILMIPTNVVSGPVGPVIVQDIAFSNTNRIQVVGLIKDALGNSYNSVSNPGPYTYFTSDGRGYQFQIPVPATSKYFLSFAKGSLANHITTNELGLAARTGVAYSNYSAEINGVIPWTPLPTNLLTSNLNPNFWLKNIWGVQSESVGWGQPFGVGLTANFISCFSAFVLSPNAVLGTLDSGIATNTMICFVDWNGDLITRVTIAETNLPGENAILYLLNSNLPPSIPPVYFMPTNGLGKIPVWTNLPSFGTRNIDLVYHSQYDAFLVGGLSYFYPGNAQISSASFINLNTVSSGPNYWSVGYWITNNTVYTWSGDSGGVIGTVIRTNFVAISAFHFPNQGPNFCGADITSGLSAFDTIQNAMQAQEQSAGVSVFPLQRIDLSQFKSY
ncbi:MAG: hypothetical protein WAO02_09850 [Verrucomicrobiia bacterium]